MAAVNIYSDRNNFSFKQYPKCFGRPLRSFNVTNLQNFQTVLDLDHYCYV